MKRLAVASVGVVLVGLLVLAAATREAPAASDPARPRVTPAQIAARNAPTLPEEKKLDPNAPKVEQQAQIDSHVDTIKQRTIAAATPCYANRKPEQRWQPAQPGFPDETTQELRLSYKIEVKGGVARVREVEQIEAERDPSSPFDKTVQDQDLANCVVEKLKALEWTTTDADGTMSLVMPIAIGDLDRPTMAKPPAPPLPKSPSDIAPIGTLRN